MWYKLWRMWYFGLIETKTEHYPDKSIWVILSAIEEGIIVIVSLIVSISYPSPYIIKGINFPHQVKL